MIGIITRKAAIAAWNNPKTAIFCYTSFEDFWDNVQEEIDKYNKMSIKEQHDYYRNVMQQLDKKKEALIDKEEGVTSSPL